MAFRFPKKFSFAKKRVEEPTMEALKNLPSFNWADLKEKEEIGRGSFGSVFVAKHSAHTNDLVVIKKLLGNEDEDRRLFLKESKLLHHLRNKNIVEFKAFCSTPLALMLEYVYFDFAPFGNSDKVSSLEDFLHYIDRHDAFEDFPFQNKIAKDIASGIAYLHQKEIAHRDLKPANVLVSNKHYSGLKNEEMQQIFGTEPIVCKLTDFGESRSLATQTATVCHTATHNVDRGSPAYMAPEIFSGNRLASAATMEDLKAIDIWALGMVFFMLLNPNMKHPFENDMKAQDSELSWRRVIEYKFAKSEMPSHDRKYEVFQATQWFPILDAFERCTHFSPSERPSAIEVGNVLSGTNDISVVRDIPLEVSQTTAVEDFDRSYLALGDHDGTNSVLIPNDATNACAFLCLKVGDLLSSESICSNTIEEWEKVASLVSNVILTFPERFNFLRNVNKFYDVMEAYKLLRKSGLISAYTMTEEMVTERSQSVFSDNGRKALVDAVSRLKDNKLQIGLYTCGGYIFLVGCTSTELFLIDTHPLSSELGSNGNGLLKVFSSVDVHSIMQLCSWIWKRLKLCGVNAEQQQSFSILGPVKSVEKDNAGKRAATTVETTPPQAHKRVTRHPFKAAADNQDGYSMRDVERCPTHLPIYIGDRMDEERPLDMCIVVSDDPSLEEDGSTASETTCGPTDQINMAHMYTTDVPKFYNDDEDLPVFQFGKKTRYTVKEAVKILMDEPNVRKCTKTPLKVRRNLSFLVDVSAYKSWEDIKSDMNGAYTRPLRIGTWTLSINGDSNVNILEKKKVELTNEHEFHIHLNSKGNTFGLCRSIFFLTGRDGEILHDTLLLQYTIVDEKCEKVEFEVLSHGNRKHGKKAFYPTQKSTMEALKEELSSNPASVAFKKVYNSSGGVCGARQPGELPRSRQQTYDLKYKLQREDTVDELLLYAKHKEDNIIIEHHDVPEDLWVLGKKHMSEDLSRFCCSSLSSYPLSVDPTFNFGQFEVTPYSYKHLLLKSKRTNEAPVFIGPTAIHYGKSATVYKKIAQAVCGSAPRLATEARGFITDGEVALHDALAESMKKATGLRCSNHFRRNCKDKLNALGIRKQHEQKVFLESVFGSGDDAIIESQDKSDLKTRLKHSQSVLDAEEKRLTGTAEPQFWTYLSKHRKMMGKSMIVSARKKAGMPCDESRKPSRCYTNQSESVNNKLTRQKEAITKKDKSKESMTKLEFVRDVWEEVDNQQQLELQMTICGLSEEYELAEEASYLEVQPDVWFQWSDQERKEYVSKVNNLSMEDIAIKKSVSITNRRENEEIVEWKELSKDLAPLFSVEKVSEGLIRTIVTEAEKLINTPNTIQRMPYLNEKDAPVKYLVAAKNCKRGMYECTKHREHVSCTCPCYRYNTLCKHSLCIAETTGILKDHIAHFTKSRRLSRPCKSALVIPEKNAAGKKGSRHKNPWRPSRDKGSNLQREPTGSHPYNDVHHNDRPLIVRFLTDEPKAKECRQCRTEFPRRKKVVPYDIILSHEERWLYPDPNNPGAKLPSARFTTKYYCVKRSCICTRFPYFDSSYVEIPLEIGSRLKDAHKVLMKVELDYDIAS